MDGNGADRAQKRKDANLTLTKLAEISELSRDTVSVACKGGRISIESARKLCAGLNLDISALFTVTEGSDALSARTVWHHHKLVRAILATAKQARIIPYNAASEHMNAPKLPREEARYLTEDEAKIFLSALQGEPDIRSLQARTGHAQASTLLNVYSHAIQSAQERAAQAMSDMLLPDFEKGNT